MGETWRIFKSFLETHKLKLKKVVDKAYFLFELEMPLINSINKWKKEHMSIK